MKNNQQATPFLACEMTQITSVNITEANGLVHDFFLIACIETFVRILNHLDSEKQS